MESVPWSDPIVWLMALSVVGIIWLAWYACDLDARRFCDWLACKYRAWRRHRRVAGWEGRREEHARKREKFFSEREMR